MMELRDASKGDRIPAYPSRYSGRNGIVRQHTGVARHRGATETGAGGAR